MDIKLWIIIFFWLMISMIISIEYLPFIRPLGMKEKILAMLVFTIGGPAFGIVAILTAILDTIFPEGWDNDDFNSGY